MNTRPIRPVHALALLALGCSTPFAAAQIGQDEGFGIFGIAAAGVAGQTENWLDVTTQPDGKIVAVGSRVFTPRGGVGTENFFVARFLPSGVLDTTFNGTGTFEFDFGLERFDRATSVNILPDGKILIGGDSVAYENIPNQFFVQRLAASDIALIRLNANGTLDSTFGISGAVRTDLSNLYDDTVARVLTLADGSIRVVGTANSSSWAIVAYSANGGLNTNFGTGGRATVSFTVPTGLRAANDAILHNGKIVITGKQGDYAPLAVARVDALTGQLDPTFGVGGIATVDIAEQPRNGITTRQGWSLAALPDGKIIVASDGTFVDFDQDFTIENPLLAVSRLTEDGRTDATFNGFPSNTIAGFQPSVAIVNGTPVLADAFAPRFTLAGNGAIAGNFDSFLVGINPLTWTTVLNFGSLAVQANGGLLAAGTSNGNAAIARFTFDGSQSEPPTITPPVVTPPVVTPVPVLTAPLAPTDFSATNLAARNVRLQWRDNATNETSYFVQRSTSANFANPTQLTVLGNNSNGFTDTTALARTTYFYRVTARNAQGAASSAILQVTTTRR